MQNNAQRQSGVTAATFVAGTLVGIGVGLLVAPKRGEEMRADIKEAGHKAKQQIHKTKESVRSKLTDARKETIERSRAARERLEAKLRDMQPEDDFE